LYTYRVSFFGRPNCIRSAYTIARQEIIERKVTTRYCDSEGALYKNKRKLKHESVSARKVEQIPLSTETIRENLTFSNINLTRFLFIGHQQWYVHFLKIIHPLPIFVFSSPIYVRSSPNMIRSSKMLDFFEK